MSSKNSGQRAGLTRRKALVALSATGAAAACAQEIEVPAYSGALSFNHGVASGDPGRDRVVIWTRVTPESEGPVPVRWIVARNRDLTDVVKTEIVEASPSRDYTVKVDVTGLRAGAPYFYGFLAGDRASAIGKTRTLPRGKVESLKIAVASCASYPHGFFNAYEAIAAQEGVDLVVHLGDYIYEYGLSGYGGDRAIALGRIPSPEVECKTVEDYRLRFAQARAEAELQAAHAICPWIVVWDDHEVANDSWSGGAQNHQPESEGAWAVRKSAALQAYYEWMPIRDPASGAAFEAINRSFQYGDLFTLVMLETRLLARTKPFDYATDTPVVMQAWDFTDPNGPLPVDGAVDLQAPNFRLLPVPFEEIAGELRPVRDWRRVSVAVRDPAHPPPGMRFMPDVARLNATLADPARALIGQQQEQWLSQQLAASKGAGVAWRLIGNQVMMAPVTAPDLSDTPWELAAALERLRPGVTALLGFTAYEIALNPDSWDGYVANRARVLDAFKQNGGAIVLTGDTHAAWANELLDDGARVGVELGATSITSPSDASYFAAAGIDFAGALQARNPHIKWTDQSNHGFVLLTLTKDEATAEFFTVSTIDAKAYETTRAAAFTIAREDAGPGPLTRV